MKKTELLAPAGNMEKLKMVFHYGADAAYLGGEIFNLRALAANFNKEELKEAVDYAHSIDKKVYVALNIIPHNDDLKVLPDYAKYLEEIGVDGVIIADLGVFSIVNELTNLRISISTQASNTNWKSVEMWKNLGAKRVVLAREANIEDIIEIRQKVPDIEIEVFVHGAMCMSISGRCLLSNYMTARDANRGTCAQSCRWRYHLMEEKRPGEYFPVFEDERGTYIFNSKDLCTIEFIDKLLEVGIDSVKIEGRMKGIYYGSIITKIYRDAIDKYQEGNFEYDSNWLKELESVSHRNYTKGFYFGRPDEIAQNYEFTSYKQTHKLVAKVIEKLENNEYIIEIRNRVYKDEILEVVKPHKNIDLKMPMMLNMKNNEEIEVAHPNTIVKIKSELNLEVLDMLRQEGE